MNIAEIKEVEKTLREYYEFESKVYDMHSEDDTDNGMIRIGEYVCNFLGLGLPLGKGLVSSSVALVTKVPEGMMVEKIEGEGIE